MSDILAPEVVVPLLADVSEESALFRLSNLRGKWVLLLFPRQGKETLIRDFLFQVERWTNEKEPDWTSYNCQIVVVSNSREIDVQHLPSITFVFDEDRTMASSFHCSEENTTFADVATVLIDSEGYIRYTIKSDMTSELKIASNLRVLRALSRNSTNDDEGEEGKAQEDIDAVSPTNDSFLSFWTKQTQSSAEQKGKDLVSEASNLLSYYQWQLRERPLLTKAITSAIISAAGEALGSWLKGSKQTFLQLLRRIGVFFVYGLCIAGPFFHWWYGFLDKYTRGFGLPRILTFIIQLALNQLVMTPAMLLVTLAFLQLSQTTHFHSIIRNVKNAYAGALFTNWRVWTVAQAINFQVVPLDYRVLFGNMVALWWNIVLSWTTSAPPSDN